MLLAGSSDASVWMWNAASGACMAVLSGHSESVTCGMFTSDGRSVITASADCSARVWDPKSSTCIVHMSDPKGLGTFHAGPITCLDTKGDFILTGSEDATAILTTLAMTAEGAPMGKVVATYKNHTLGVESVAISPSTQYVRNMCALSLGCVHCRASWVSSNLKSSGLVRRNVPRRSRCGRKKIKRQGESNPCRFTVVSVLPVRTHL